MSKAPIRIEGLPGYEWIAREITIKDLNKAIPFHADLIKTVKKNGGSLMRIANFPCYIPPQPERKKFLNHYITNPLHQKWTRQLLTLRNPIAARKSKEDAMTSKPVTMGEWINYVKAFDKLYAEYVIENGDISEFMELSEREKDRIWNGCWIFVKGVPKYISGSYYFYLNYWSSKEGRGITYIECDREEFIHFEAILKSHPKFRGTVHYRCRQDGKSLRHSCKMYWLSLITQNDCWIQSVDGDDVKKIFESCISNQWANLPIIFKPHTTKELSELLGVQIKHTAIEKKKKDTSLIIKFAPTRENPKGGGLNGIPSGTVQAAVGRTGIAKWDDETGQTKDVDTMLRKEKSMESMMYYFISTTIDDTSPRCLSMCKEMWETSDYAAWERAQLAGGSNKSTDSELVSYFKPAWYCLWNRSKGIKTVDEWGQPQIEKAWEILNSKREEYTKKGKYKELLEEKRHYPFIPPESFMPDPSNSQMDIGALSAQNVFIDEAVTKGETFMVRDGVKYNLPLPYRLEWENGVKFGKVKAVYDKNGKHFISEMPAKPNAIKRSIQKDGSILFTPENDINCGGTDTINKDMKDLNGRNKYSEGATVTFIRPTGFLEKENIIIHYYCDRPQLVDAWCEEILKADFFFGRTNSIEDNKMEMIQKFYVDNGCDGFIASKLDIQPLKDLTEKEYHSKGTNLNSISKPHLFRKTVDYVNQFADRIFFTYILQQGMGVTLDNLTYHDVWAAFMQAYGLATMPTVKQRHPPSVAQNDRFQIFRQIAKGLKAG